MPLNRIGKIFALLILFCLADTLFLSAKEQPGHEERDQASPSQIREEGKIDTLKVDLLDTLRKVSPEVRRLVFSKIYRQELWHLDSADVLSELNRLGDSHFFEKDKELEVALITVKGLYYQQKVENGMPKAAYSEQIDPYIPIKNDPSNQKVKRAFV